MDLRRVMIAAVLLLPGAASARDTAVCADLYRQLHDSPEIIGNTREMRRYAQELGRKNTDIRALRTDMRRNGCGGGSIVQLGSAPDDSCEEMRRDLEALEAEREALVVERRDTLGLVRSQSERAPVLAAIRENSCIPSDLEQQNKLEQEERLKVPGLQLPKDEQPYSGITDLRGRPSPNSQTAVADGPPPVPDRPYDPAQQVRTVGPVFFPEQSIDLAHPKTPGSQPQQ